VPTSPHPVGDGFRVANQTYLLDSSRPTGNFNFLDAESRFREQAQLRDCERTELHFKAEQSLPGSRDRGTDGARALIRLDVGGDSPQRAEPVPTAGGWARQSRSLAISTHFLAAAASNALRV
jgi:hypothetical protein